MADSHVGRLPRDAARIPLGAAFGRTMPNGARYPHARPEIRGICPTEKNEVFGEGCRTIERELFVPAVPFIGRRVAKELIDRKIAVERLEYIQDALRIPSTKRLVEVMTFEILIKERLRT